MISLLTAPLHSSMKRATQRHRRILRPPPKSRGPGSPSQKAKLQPPGTQASRTDRACRVESRLGRWPGVQLVRADQPGSNAGDAPMLSGREPRQPCLAETARSHTRRKGIESLPPLALGPHPLSQSRTPPGQTDLPRRQAERARSWAARNGLPGRRLADDDPRPGVTSTRHRRDGRCSLARPLGHPTRPSTAS